MIQRFPSVIANGLVNMTGFARRLSAIREIQRERFSFSEHLNFHRPRTDFDLFAFVTKNIFVKSLLPVRRVSL